MKDLFAIKSTLAALKPELEEKFHVKSIGIFGSATRSDFTPESDVDIIVDFNQTIGVEFIDLAEFLESKLAFKIDLVTKNGIKPEYYTLIEQEIVYV
ncbi:MAG: DNA polymerase subunit beta [Chitinophagaceae bacterium]|nr:DNA polymerase subunit beta [Chitinophagaceae bacterium]